MKGQRASIRIRNGCFALCLMAAVASLAAPQGQKPPAPHDLQIIDAQGYRKIVEQHRGQPLLVNFWATWCEPCRHEYPMLNELAKQYAPQGLKVVGVNLDDEGDLILMRRFLARYKPVFPNYRKKPGNEEEFREAVLAGWNGSLPVSVLYARDGRQAGHVLGEGTRETYEAAIRSLLGSRSN